MSYWPLETGFSETRGVITQEYKLKIAPSDLACVAGARKEKGEGKIGRARNARSEREGKRKLPPPPFLPKSRRSRALDFPSLPSLPPSIIAPATQATSDYELCEILVSPSVQLQEVSPLNAAGVPVTMNITL